MRGLRFKRREPHVIGRPTIGIHHHACGAQFMYVFDYPISINDLRYFLGDLYCEERGDQLGVHDAQRVDRNIKGEQSR